MRRRVFIFAILAAVLGGYSTLLAGVAPYKFKVTDIRVHFSFFGEDNEALVQLADINDKSAMIGNTPYGDAFLVDKNKKTTEIRCPGDPIEHSTVVSAINNVGQIVGSCSLGGFVRDANNTFTLLDFPGAGPKGTIPYGINDLGHIVGIYNESACGVHLGCFHGFVWKDGEYTSFDVPFPEALFTQLVGINNAGQIIGIHAHHVPGGGVNDFDNVEGFLYDNGNFIALNFPDAKYPLACLSADCRTYPMDINNLGQIVGLAYDSEGKRQYFLYEEGEYSVIAGLPEHTDNVWIFPAAVWGMNDNGDIAASYVQVLPCGACGPDGEPYYTFTEHSYVANPKKLHTKKVPVKKSR
jgi:hypothetical protein